MEYYTENLQSHYKAVRERIVSAAPQPPKPKPLITHRPVPDRTMPPLQTPRHLMIERMKVILAQYDVTWEDTFSHSKRARYILPKWHVWCEMMKLGWSYNAIAKFCRPTDPYNHSTILHGVQQYRKFMGPDLPPPAV
jgi:hypothetical protein